MEGGEHPGSCRTWRGTRARLTLVKIPKGQSRSPLRGRLFSCTTLVKIPSRPC